MTTEDGTGEAGHGDNQWRHANRRSNWVQAALIFGFTGLIIALDWGLNSRLTYVAPVGIGLAVGLAAGAVIRARRRRARRGVG